MRRASCCVVMVILLASIGCATLETHRIVPISRLDWKVTKVTQETPQSKETESTVKQGVWLARFVSSQPPGGARTQAHGLSAIEIIFCPAGEDDYTQCRIGVAWSKERPRLGARAVAPGSAQ